jgi:arabinose-5-phosphate isomerase
MSPMNDLSTEQADKALALAAQTLSIEADAILALKTRLGTDFLKAVQSLLSVRGRVVVMGMGKSGHIGRKIAATLASTGTPAFFCTSRRGQPWRLGHGHPG